MRSFTSEEVENLEYRENTVANFFGRGFLDRRIGSGPMLPSSFGHDTYAAVYEDRETGKMYFHALSVPRHCSG